MTTKKTIGIYRKISCKLLKVDKLSLRKSFGAKGTVREQKEVTVSHLENIKQKGTKGSLRELFGNN